jgi:uncharacterized protein YdbL (DUF1318 family)
MTRATTLPVLALLASLSACVTINVYFPAAAAERAADKVIDEVWGGRAAPPPATAPVPAPAAPVPAPEPLSLAPQRWLLALLNTLVPAAQAQEEPNLDVSSPEITRLTKNMEARFDELAPWLDSGAIGLSADGFLAQRDANAVPLAERNNVRNLVANENADRAALYREMASINKQPQWEPQIRAVFAKRWIARAKAGWYYRTADGEWLQK